MIILPQTRGVLHAGRDPHIGSVVLLNHFDELISTQAKSAIGGHLNLSGTPATLSATQVKFGPKSLYTGAEDSDRAVSSENYTIGTSDFTKEGWFYTSSVSVFQCTMAIGANSVDTTALRTYIGNDGSIRYYFGATARITSAASLVTINTWHFWQVRRIGTATELGFNGVKVGSTYTDTNNYTGNPVWVGMSNYPGADEAVRGYTDDIRLTIGVGRAFGVPSSPFPNSG